MHFYYLPLVYKSDDNSALGICISGVLTMLRAPGDNPSDLFTPLAVFDRLFQGGGQGGEDIVQWELVRWGRRGGTEAQGLVGNFRDSDFLVWTSEDSPYEPKWRVYSEPEFKKAFIEACRNFIREHPNSVSLIEEALLSNGMSLIENA